MVDELGLRLVVFHGDTVAEKWLASGFAVANGFRARVAIEIGGCAWGSSSCVCEAGRYTRNAHDEAGDDEEGGVLVESDDDKASWSWCTMRT